MTFEEINKENGIPKSRNYGPYKKRYIFKHVLKTWLSEDPQDRQWFDNAEVYKLLKDSLISKLESLSFGYISKININVPTIPEFEKHVDTVLDCWLLYQMKKFRNIDCHLILHFFPMWNDPKNDVNMFKRFSCLFSIILKIFIIPRLFHFLFRLQFQFNLYTEVKRVREKIDEYEDGKRLWWELTDMTNEIYEGHYNPSYEQQKTYAILTTEQYVPPYLRTKEFNFGTTKSLRSLYDKNICTCYQM